MIPRHIPVVAIALRDVRPLRACRRPTTPKMIAATGNNTKGTNKTNIILVIRRPQNATPQTNAIHGGRRLGRRASGLRDNVLVSPRHVSGRAQRWRRRGGPLLGERLILDEPCRDPHRLRWLHRALVQLGHWTLPMSGDKLSRLYIGRVREVVDPSAGPGRTTSRHLR